MSYLKVTSENCKKLASHFSRPHNKIPGFLEWRRQVNFKEPITTHPFAKIIHEWSLSEEMLTTTGIVCPRQQCFIDNEELLSEMAHNLECYNEIAIDGIIYANSYSPIISTLQVSNTTTDYVVDTVVLFQKIKEYIGPLLQNPRTLKIVSSSSLIVSLQRNFDIYPVGVIELQESYGLIERIQQNISLEIMVEKLLGFSPDNLLGRLDWLQRPLHITLIDFAFSQSLNLLRCWIKIKENSVFIEHEPFLRSKADTVKIYTPQNNATSAWHSYVNSLSIDLKNIFCTPGQKLLFETLYNWRENRAKLLDVKPDHIVEDLKIQFITRAMPTKAKVLKSNHFAQMNKYLDNDGINEILCIIKTFQRTMFLCPNPLSQNVQPPRMVQRVAFTPRLYDFSSDVETDFCESTQQVALRSDGITENNIFTAQNELPNSSSKTQVVSESKSAQKQRRHRRNLRRRNQVTTSKNDMANLHLK